MIDRVDRVDEVGKLEEERSKRDVPEHETDCYTDLPPMEEVPKELLGRYQKVGECKYCHASIYVEEYGASRVKRPRLIYTCAEDCLAGFDARDVLWSPKFFVVDLSKLEEVRDEDKSD